MAASTRLRLLYPDAFCLPPLRFHALTRGTLGSYAHSPVLGDELQVAVALCGLGLSRLAQHRRGAWWHDDLSIRITADHVR